MKLQQSYINQTRENKAKPNSDYDNCFKQSKHFQINIKLSVAGQTFNLQGGHVIKYCFIDRIVLTTHLFYK